MHISDVHEYSPGPTTVVEEFIAKGRKEQIKSAVEQLVEDEFERLREYGDEYISQVAAIRAERFLERVLNGDDDAAMALRVALRRRIVEAHAELLRNERIADLESVVAGLTQQVRELIADLERCRERLSF